MTASSRLSRAAPLLVAAGLIALGALMRLPAVLGYHGPALPHPFNVFEMGRVGGYSDIAHLYFRDRLWLDPAPYLDYRFEYPVLTGAFVWLASLAGGSLAAYFLASTALLTGFGAMAAEALRRIDGANVWIFAAAPALAFYGVLNWDLLGVCLLVVALALLQRGRDVPAAWSWRCRWRPSCSR